ncbi:MAG: hypothetical protein JWO03_2269 [Bacteroidetes bacterium]|nr:hypothetical protein [Bacteroidota bacterium]
MDHSSAHLTELAVVLSTKVIDSRFTHEEKEAALSKSESTMHNMQQHQRAEYYKKIVEAIKDYEEVLLFGPTGAKLELFNIMLADHRCSKIKLEVKNSDKLVENQQHAFIKDYFSKHLVA